DFLLAASSPTGPAFEGAQISSGQRAAPGAIERVRIDRATLEPRFRVIGSELWSDEPGFAEATAETGITGICGSGIVEVIAELFPAMVLGLIPDAPLDRVKAAGNAAGTGALIALLSGAARREIEGVVRRVEKIETAVEPRFQEHFVEAMAFPHRTAPSTHLAR